MKTAIHALPHLTTSRFTRKFIALSIVSALAAATAQAQPVSGLYFLGDSTTDSGVWGYKLTNQGDMWSETLSHRLGYSGAPAYLNTDPNELNFVADGNYIANGGNNYAVAGATISFAPEFFPTLADEVSVLLDHHDGRLNDKSLVILSIGPNDIGQYVDAANYFGWPDKLPTPESLKATAHTYAQQVQRLKAAGAKNIVAFTVGDYAYTPGFVQTGDADLLAGISNRTAVLNAALRRELADTGVYVIDFNKLAGDLVSNYTKYGFTVGNTESLCVDTSKCQHTPNDGHLFADGAHVTSDAQLVFADYVTAQLRARDQFASLLTQPMVAMRQETAGLEARLTSNAFFKNNANGQPSRRAVGDVQAFGGATYNRVNNDSTGGFDPGAKGNSTGGTIGADVIAADNLLLGGKLAYSQFDGDFGSHSGDYQRNTTSLSAYGAWQPLAQTTLNFALTYGYLDYNNITRKAQLGSVAHASAKGDTSGNYVAARLGGGYDFALQDWTLTPNVALTYERVKLDGYSEKDSVLAIAYGDSTYNAMRGSLGLNLALTGGSYKVRPYARISLEHDFRSGDLTVYAGPDKGLLAGYDVTRPDRTFGMGTLGTNVALTDRVGLNLSYHQTFQQNHFSAWAANAGLQLDF